MVKIFRCIQLAAFSLVVSSFLVSVVQAESVRFYELTKKDKEKRIFKVGSMQGAGCHSFLRKQYIHRFSQVGFQACTLYSKRKCKEGSIVTATWAGKSYKRANIDVTQPQEELLQGSEWVLAERNKLVRSWKCEAQE